jgi:homeobox-leucine zipper protein
MRNNNAEYGGRNKRENEGEAERVSDDDENGSTRKKLRLSKDQSAFLEESFKEHTTLNPVYFSFLIFVFFLIKDYLFFISN